MSGYNPYAGGPAAYSNGANMHHMDGSMQGNNMMMGGENGMNHPGSGQSLEDIVNHNNNFMRRQSMSQHYGGGQNGMSTDLGDLTMMDFGTNSPGAPLDHFSFDPSATMAGDMMNTQASMNLPDQSMNHSGRQSSAADMSMNPAFTNASSTYNPVSQHSNNFQPTAGPNSQTLDMDLNASFMSNPMGMNMDFTSSPNLASMAVDHNNMALFGQPAYHPSMMNSPLAASPINTAVPSNLRPLSQDNGGNVTERQMSRFDLSQNRSSSETTNSTPRASQSRSQSMNTPTMAAQQSSQSQPQQQPASQSQALQQRHSIAAPLQRHQSQPTFNTPPQNNQQNLRPEQTSDQRTLSTSAAAPAQNKLTENFGWKTPEGGWPSSMAGRPHMESGYKNAYSSTGFDMLGVLMRVATRPKPEINIGSVDFSCAFVVCDAEKDDIPIVYCSDNFERLTGYTRHMILGRNCRFLQSPDGLVEPGVKRQFVDDDSILYLKNMVNTRKEAQISLINYRRGGQPFMNLLTVIPITWDSDTVKFFVGFQVDLVEQPNAVTDRNPDGSYSINYQRGLTMPRYVMNNPETSQNKAELGQTIPRDDVSAILSTIGSGESEYAKRMWDKVLLENTDDVVHVLSLKGLFQWVSPSSFKVLEYDPAELIGTALSSVCHPSDIVPVTRELKDTSTGASVNVVFRIRRKNSGYMWFEGHGSLHTEQGKGRKSIILVGRERPVYTLSKADIQGNNGIGENELWTKMSTSGMFLYVSSNVRQLLDRQPDELIGVSIQSMMRADSKSDFVRVLEHARTGKKASVKHEMINRRGQVLQAFTTLYPGDATEGQKPTFIVAQTRLIKYPRGNGSGRPNTFGKDRGSETPVSTKGPTTGDSTPMSSQMSLGQYVPTDGAAPTYGGQNGLALGHQDASLASDDNLFDELKTTKSSSWQYEIRQLEKRNRMLAEEVQSLLAAKKKRKRRKGAGQMQKDCANCHTRVTPEWRRGPSGQRDLCNSCGLRWAKLNGRVSPRTTSQGAGSDRNSQASSSPRHQSIDAQAGAPVKLEHGHHMSRTAQLAGHSSAGMGGATSPREGGHAANMEGASGVPERIIEGDEPD